jgi:[acyl-carrier-protein] S-malonyltransferase
VTAASSLRDGHNAAMHEWFQLIRGLEHPGDSNQPDNLHRH